MRTAVVGQLSVLDEERDRAERKVNSVRGVVLVVLAIAAAAYAPVLPRSLNVLNAAVLVPMLAWTAGRRHCSIDGSHYRPGSRL